MTNYTKQDYERDLQIVALSAMEDLIAEKDITIERLFTVMRHRILVLNEENKQLKAHITEFDKLEQKDAEHKAEIGKLKQNNTHSGLRAINQKKSLEIEKLKQENEELNSQIEFKIKECMELAQACSRYKQSVAQHDKQVCIKAVTDFFNFLSSDDVAVLSDKSPRLSEYMNKIKEQ